MKTHRTKKVVATVLAAAMVATMVPATAFAADSWPLSGDQARGKAQPHFSGYRIQDMRDWNPETDPYAEMMRAKVPLQNRNEAFKPTQANPDLDSKAEIMLMQGDYGNSFFDSTMYTNAFSEHVLNFWQYTDYFCPWHGAASVGVPQALYDPATSHYLSRGFEFGLLNIPNPAYTNAAHKNGVLSVACLYFDSSFRPGQSWDELLEQDPDGSFPVAKQLVEMARYYGYDGYFLNQEGGNSDKFKAFMSYLTAEGLYTQWYDRTSAFNENKAEWLSSDGYDVINNSVFINYGWSAESSLNYAEEIGVDPFKQIFFGLECNSGRFSDSKVTQLYDSDSKNPRGSIALFTPSDYYQRSLDDNIKDGYGVSYDKYALPLMQRAEYQWMVMERERMFFSGVTSDPTDTGIHSGYSRDDVAVKSASGWVGAADFTSERSVIGGSTFYSNFNTGHGMQYYLNGQMATDSEWANINIQDILPTWQWWIDAAGENEGDVQKLNADFDYGSAYRRVDIYGNDIGVPYASQVGGYNGGSSLVLYGNLESKNTMHLFKTDLDVKADSKASVTFKKTSDDAVAMKLGLIFKDAPDVIKEYDIEDSAVQGEWVTREIALGEDADREIAAICLVFDGSAENYQMNVGQIKVMDGTVHKPATPKNFQILNAYDSGEMELTWDLASYDEVELYNIYATLSDGSYVYLGGIYDDVFYVKSVFDEKEIINLELKAVSADGTESDAATTSFTYNDKPSNIVVEEAKTETGLLTQSAVAEALNVSWTAPENTDFDSYEFMVKLNFLANDNPDNKFYYFTADKDATSATVPLPVKEGYDYTLGIRTVKDGVKSDFICYRGNSKDTFTPTPLMQDVQVSSGWGSVGLSFHSPRPKDWYKINVSMDGVAVGSRKRGGDTLSMSLSKTEGTVEITYSDYSGNTSDPLRFYVYKGFVLSDKDEAVSAKYFPDAVLRRAVIAQIGEKMTDVLDYVGPFDLSNSLVLNFAGLDILSGVTELNLSRTVLTELKPNMLPQNITKLNLSGCEQLTTIEEDTLGMLSNLQELDLSNCLGLNTLYLNSCKATSVDISGCSELITLNASNSRAAELALAGLTSLETVDLSKSSVTAIDVSGCAALKTLNASGSVAATLHVAGCTALTDLNMSSSKAETIDVTSCTALETLNASGSAASVINAAGCANLNFVDVSNGGTGSIDVSSCTALQTLNVAACTAKTLNASGCTALQNLDAGKGKLEEINVSGCSALAKLYANDSALNTVDFTGCTALTHLYLNNTKLETITASNGADYTNIYMANLAGAQMDLSEGTPERQFITQMEDYLAEHEITPQVGERANLALKQKVSSNLSGGYYGPESVVDGNNSYGYFSMRNNGDYITIDLGSEQTIQDWKVYFDGSYYTASDFTLEVSNDGENFTLVESVTGNAKETYTSNFAEPVTARYFKYTFVKAVSYSGDLKEIELYGNPVDPYGLHYDNQRPKAYVDLNEIPATITLLQNSAEVLFQNYFDACYANAKTIRGNAFADLKGADWIAADYDIEAQITPPEGTVVTIVDAQGNAFEDPYQLTTAGAYTVHYADAQGNEIAVMNLKVVADKEELNHLLDVCGKLQEEDYLPNSWVAFAQQLAAAQAVAEEEFAQQSEVDDAFIALVTAKLGLEKKPIKGVLQSMIEMAQGLDISNSTPASVEALQAALEQAIQVNEDPDANQEAVNAAVKELLTAVNNLRDIEDNSRLVALINAVEKMDLSSYTDASVTALRSALSEAKTVAGDQNATYEEITDAYKTLANAVINLVPGVNTQELRNTIQIAEDILQNIDQYRPSTVKGLKAATEAAKAVLANRNATQEEINKAAQELAEEIAKARVLSNKAIIVETVEQAKLIDTKLFTEESVNMLKTAIDQANTVILDIEADQITVDSVDHQLKAAIENLVPLKTEPEVPTDPSKPENPEKPDPSHPEKPAEPENPTTPSQPLTPANPENPAQPGNSTSTANPTVPKKGDNGGKGGNANAKTGDSDALFAVPVLMLSAAALLLMLRKKEREQ